MSTITKWFALGFSICLLITAVSALGSGAMGGNSLAGNSHKPVKMVVTGNTMTPIAAGVEHLALDDGIWVYDRSDYLFGVLVAETNLIKQYGCDRAREQAQGVIQNLSSEFFADVWIDFNGTHEITRVTIRVGRNRTTLTFPTPLTPADTQARASEVYNTAMGMPGM